jgi:hypothetical protein
MSGHHDEVDRVLGGVAHDLRRRRPDLAARRGVPPEAIRLIKHGAEAPADAALLPSRHIGRCARVCGHVQQMQRRAARIGKHPSEREHPVRRRVEGNRHEDLVHGQHCGCPFERQSRLQFPCLLAPTARRPVVPGIRDIRAIVAEDFPRRRRGGGHVTRASPGSFPAHGCHSFLRPAHTVGRTRHAPCVSPGRSPPT